MGVPVRDYGDLDTCMPHVPLFVCSCKLVYTNSCSNCVVAIHLLAGWLEGT
jgi:hypothetical protein